MAAALATLDAAPGPRIVALSGGRDSIALLDAAAAVARARAQALVAVHVHHGLSPNADAWAAFCEARAAAYGVPCVVARVNVARAARRSVEAEARRLRYDALRTEARRLGARVVLLAHHRDDQAETLLLQLLRGAGPHGLAAMPSVRTDGDGVAWLRPLLGVARADIDAYCAERGLAHVDDESNGDARYARNALRHRALPALAAIAPGSTQTLARAAALQADAAALADDLADLDARDAVADGTLDCAALSRLAPHRARNLLRAFLHGRGLPSPSQARLGAMLAQLAAPRPDARVRLAHAGAEIGVYRGRVVVHAPPPPPYERAWRGERLLSLPHGQLAFEGTTDGGLDVARLQGSAIVVRSRQGGERLTLDRSGPRRTLAHVLQHAAVPAWERDALPLVFCDGDLAAVPGVGVDVRFRAAPGADGVALVWTPDA